jgi:hypothetical protein
MWYRDEAAVGLRLQELRSEAEQNALARLGARGESEGWRRSRRLGIRSASAAAFRWLGQQALGLSNRLDPGPGHYELYRSAGTVAYR